MGGLVTCLEYFCAVERFTDEFLHVSSNQKDDGHQSHQHPGEDEAESNAAVVKNRQVQPKYTYISAYIQLLKV